MTRFVFKRLRCSELWAVRLSIILVFSGSVLSAQEPRRQIRLQHYPEALNYLVIGDWGLGNSRQREVAAQMARVAQQVDVDFIITTGDNFYPSGVTSERDTLWKTAFEDVYDSPSLHVPWYPVLGNHDYGTNPDAQIRYTDVSDRWEMPSRYYKKIFPVPKDSTTKVMFLFIDTAPLIPGNYEKNLAVNGNDTTAQLSWIKKSLSEVPSDVKWIYVVGHHPVYTAGERSGTSETRYTRSVLQPLFSRYTVDAYLSGHEHNLQVLRGSDGLHQFISGGGFDTRLVNPFVRRFFAKSAFGFMLFSVLKDKTLVQIINRKGRVLYRYEILAGNRVR